ncbi:MAG: DUF4169 family protein [Pseudomonadota bacterium]
MSKPINLRAARKHKARDDARKEADANAARHGRAKTAKTKDEAEMAKARRHLDGHKREE